MSSQSHCTQYETSKKQQMANLVGDTSSVTPHEICLPSPPFTVPMAQWQRFSGNTPWSKFVHISLENVLTNSPMSMNVFSQGVAVFRMQGKQFIVLGNFFSRSRLKSVLGQSFLPKVPEGVWEQPNFAKFWKDCIRAVDCWTKNSADSGICLKFA